MNQSYLLFGVMAVTANLALSSLFFGFWLRERSARWNLYWTYSYLAAAGALVVRLNFGPQPLLPEAILAGAMVGGSVATFVAGVCCLLEPRLLQLRRLCGLGLACAFVISLAADGNAVRGVTAATLVLAAAYFWGGLRLFRGGDGLARVLAVLFLLRSFQLAIYGPLVMNGYDIVAFTLGHFMTLATGFGLLFISLVRSESRLVEMSWKLSARNAALTERDQALTEMNETLGDLAVKLELKNVEYAEALRLAEDANRAKSQFLANISHELRTPLNAILGFSEFLQLTGASDTRPRKMDEYLGYIMQAGRLLLAHVNTLLDTAKIEMQDIKLARAIFPLKREVEASIALLDFAVAAKEVKIKTDIPDDLTISADPQRLNQVLVNVLGNAIKFSPPTGTIHVSARLEAGNQLSLSIDDSGPGIDIDDREAVFEPFWQKSIVEIREHGGIGLGLTVVRRIIEAHNGYVWIDDAPGSGTRVAMVFPAGQR